jgi:hypothetical protein
MRRRSAWSLGVGLVVLSAAAAAAQAPADAVPAISAEIEQVVLSPEGRQVSVTTFTVLLADTRARVEHGDEPGRSNYAEYQIYDFSRMRLYRVFPDDRVYFEGALAAAMASKAFVEGWGPPPQNLAVRTIPLKDDALSGSPAQLSLVERRSPRGRAPEYALVWTAVPPGRLPLRVVYTQPGGHTVVLAYRRVEARAIDASSVSVPEAFVNLSPF